MFPNANGLRLIQQSVKSEDSRKSPIIVISGRADEGYKESNGGTITVDELINTVKRLLKHPSNK